MIVRERGRLGEFNPAQVPLGRSLPRILEALGVQAFWADDEGRLGGLVRGRPRWPNRVASPWPSSSRPR